MEKIEELKEKSRRIRINLLKMLERAGSGHTGGSLSAVDCLIGLYFYKMKHNPKDPKWPERDIFILSKGHAAPALYAVLAEAGYFPEEKLKTLRAFGSELQGHPSSLYLPGIEFSSGMLGQGLSFANGMALRAKIKGNPRCHYVLMSDAEMQYGQTWQAAQTAAHWKLEKVCAIVDYNQFQSDGRVKIIKNIEPLKDKWEKFGWIVFEIDGHNLEEIINSLDQFPNGLPTLIIANTLKGKGVSFMENKNEYHSRAPNRGELEGALRELGGELWKD